MKVILTALFLTPFLLGQHALGQANAYKLHKGTDLVASLAGLGFLGVSYGLANNQVGLSSDFVQNADIHTVWGFDRIFVSLPQPWADRASDATALLAAASPIGLLWATREKSTRFTLAVMAFETAVYTSALAYGLKWATLRPRPYVYFQDSPYDRYSPDARHSFVSGHAAVASSLLMFSVVTWHTIDQQSFNPLLAIVGAGSLVLGTAALRVVAGKHFVSDVAAGILLGAAVGWSVPRLHATGKRHGISMLPYLGGMRLVFTL